MDFETAFSIRHAFGSLVGLRIAGQAPGEVLSQLEPAERKRASSMAAGRAVLFAAGRTAARRAAAGLGLGCAEIGVGPRGAPRFGPGLSGSISHKRELAVALVAQANGACLGVDAEPWEPARPAIERLVLGAGERAEIAALEGGLRWRELLLRFCFKEALFKALDRLLPAGCKLGFEQVRVRCGRDGSAALQLPAQVGARIEARWWDLAGHAIACVRAKAP
ncbi:MAG: 4'-phosphopantetheinyl transferase superfamily protein [Deltaproteobacteria bacterium]|nr:4'-phosphopantetheinyl transferase superfamily protein [Deltaproteobacteria bacterium]